MTWCDTISHWLYSSVEREPLTSFFHTINTTFMLSSFGNTSETHSHLHSSKFLTQYLNRHSQTSSTDIIQKPSQSIIFSLHYTGHFDPKILCHSHILISNFFLLDWYQSFTVQQTWAKVSNIRLSYHQLFFCSCIFWRYHWNLLSSLFFKIAYTISEPTFLEFSKLRPEQQLRVLYGQSSAPFNILYSLTQRLSCKSHTWISSNTESVVWNQSLTVQQPWTKVSCL